MTTYRDTPCQRCQNPVIVEERQDAQPRLGGADLSVRTVERCTNPDCITNAPDAPGLPGTNRP